MGNESAEEPKLLEKLFGFDIWPEELAEEEPREIMTVQVKQANSSSWLRWKGEAPKRRWPKGWCRFVDTINWIVTSKQEVISQINVELCNAHDSVMMTVKLLVHRWRNW